MIKMSEFPGRMSDAELRACYTTPPGKVRRKSARDAALNKIVLSSMRDGVYYLKSLARGRNSDSELVSIAYSALLRAALRYDPKKLTPFMTFAKAFLRGTLFREWRRQNRANGRVDHLDKLVESAEPGAQLEEAPPRVPKELQTEPEFDEIHLREIWDKFEPYLSRLNRLERMVIEYRYMRGWKFSEMGRHFKRSKQNYQAIHHRAILKLRKALGVSC
jgi:RNA polymerase sigma factor (sigma-70 family)